MDTTSRPPQRRIKRLLVANRGEIATRIISTARELDIVTYAVYTSGDASHAAGVAHAIQLPSAATFMDISALIDVVKKHQIDAVHPGYGFLSESEEFAKRMWEEADAVVVGPGWTILAATGDKLKARCLAEQYNVPVSPALPNPTNDVSDIRAFALMVGYPIMVKAVDGGGGRGIRIVRDEESLASIVKRAVEESPSKQVFAEKAAADGFRHIEVQIIGDGRGNVTHLWERECSIQRRYQKVVELAPSGVADRKLIARIIEDAVRMAQKIRYFSLGTFEFLANPSTAEYYFLEVNPRLQVEHTVTESISMMDIVRIQLLLAQGANLEEAGLPSIHRPPETPPPAHSIQLRITAENVQNDWSLSIGKVQSFQFLMGNGIRVDTHLMNDHPSIVSADFDSLLAKLIVTAHSWPDAVRKARRALEDTQIRGVKTNLDTLRAIVAHPDFLAGKCDTQWLECKREELLKLGQQISTSFKPVNIADQSLAAASSTSASSGSMLLRKGDAWTIALSPQSDQPRNNSQARPHHLELTRVLRNGFPTSLSADILFTSPPTSPNSKPTSTPYTVTLTSTFASSAATTSSHHRGNPSDPTHVRIPFPGKLVEVLVDEGDVVKEGNVICVVQQMKMELEVRSHRAGRVSWVLEVEEGEEVDEGMLAAVVEEAVGRGDARL